MVVHHGLDGGVDELDDKNKDQAGDEDEVLDKGEGKYEREGQEDGGENDFLAEGAFVFEGGSEAFEGICEGVEDALQAAFAFVRTGLVFHNFQS